VRGDQAAFGFGLVLAVGAVQLGTGVAVQLLVHRLDLFPQAVGFRADLLGRHVVAAAPHLPGIGEAHFLGAFVDQADEALVVGAHRLGGGVPTLPGVQLLVVVAAAGQHFFQVAQLAAGGRVGLVGAVLARAVRAFHAAGDAGQLAQLGRVARGRHGGHQLEQVDLALGVLAHRLAVVLASLGDPAVEDGQPAFVGLGRHALGIVIDVGRGQPLGRGHFRVQRLVLGVDAGDELVRGFGRRGGACGRCIGRGRVLLAGRQRQCGSTDSQGQQERAVVHGDILGW